MSKLVATIDDEEYVGCPLEHEGYCHIAWNKYYKCMEDCDGVLNDRPEFCPLKEYKEAIPVDWLLKRAKLCTADYADCLHYAVEAWQTEQKYIVNGQWKFPKEWEKENEQEN